MKVSARDDGYGSGIDSGEEAENVRRALAGDENLARSPRRGPRRGASRVPLCTPGKNRSPACAPPPCARRPSCPGRSTCSARTAGRTSSRGSSRGACRAPGNRGTPRATRTWARWTWRRRPPGTRREGSRRAIARESSRGLSCSRAPSSSPAPAAMTRGVTDERGNATKVLERERAPSNVPHSPARAVKGSILQKSCCVISPLDPSRIFGSSRGLDSDSFGSIRGKLRKYETVFIRVWASPLRDE